MKFGVPNGKKCWVIGNDNCFSSATWSENSVAIRFDHFYAILNVLDYIVKSQVCIIALDKNFLSSSF